MFCEKPLCGTVEETERVLAAARSATGSLWEAFVFPFHQQMDRARAMLAAGAIGEVREIQSRFHFVLDDPNDIRFFADLAGGSIQDVGCYPIRLARLLFDAEPDLPRAIADAEWTPDGADTELWGALVFPGDRRLVFSCGFRSGYDTLTRVLGTEGEIRMTGPFHPDSNDEMVVIRDGKSERQPATTTGEMSFTPPIRHIHRVVRGLEEPRHLAVDEAMGTRLRSPRYSMRPGRVRNCVDRSAPGGSRTPNLLIRSQMLYPLSYRRGTSSLPRPPDAGYGLLRRSRSGARRRPTSETCPEPRDRRSRRFLRRREVRT